MQWLTLTELQKLRRFNSNVIWAISLAAATNNTTKTSNVTVETLITFMVLTLMQLERKWIVDGKTYLPP